MSYYDTQALSVLQRIATSLEKIEKHLTPPDVSAEVKENEYKQPILSNDVFGSQICNGCCNRIAEHIGYGNYENKCAVPWCVPLYAKYQKPLLPLQ